MLPLATRPWWVGWLRPAGVIGTAIGATTVAVMALVLMVTGMSDPATPWVGLVPGPGGAPTLVVQREGAAGVTEVLVESAAAPHEVLWSIERVPGAAWDGVVALGAVPQGFIPVVPAGNAPIPAGSTIVVTNGCYASYLTMPRKRLEPHMVTTEDEVVSLDEFSSDGGAFSSCGAPAVETPLAVAGGGLVLLLCGVVLLAAPVRRRIG